MAYLISYLSVGLLMIVTITIHTPVTGKSWVIRAAIVLFFWPILLLVAPDSFLATQANSKPSTADEESSILKTRLSEAKEKAGLTLSADESKRIEAVARYGINDRSCFGNGANFQNILNEYWEHEIPPENYFEVQRTRLKLTEDYDPDYDSGIRFSRAPPAWFIGLSHSFLKSIAKVDKVKQGRILEAIAKISTAPIEIHGDTIKPLTGDMSGLWRCRIGDDRLIYFPEPSSKKVVLISFSPRGSAYEDSSDMAGLAGKLDD